MKHCLLRGSAVATLALTLASCQPADRDIRVVWRQERLVVDFPWSIWRLVGLQDRTWCVRKIELFDSSKLLWTLEMQQKPPVYHSCYDVTMPIAIGANRSSFVAKGRPTLRDGVRYGIRVDGLGNGRVDFVLRGQKAPQNISDWKQLMAAPCGSYFGECRRPSAS